MPNLKLKSVSIKKLFGDNNIELDLEKEDGIAVIIGQNGCGKTTILNLISFCLSPTYKGMQKIQSVAFSSITCTFSDNTQVTLQREGNTYLLTLGNGEKISYAPIDELIDVLYAGTEVPCYADGVLNPDEICGGIVEEYNKNYDAVEELDQFFKKKFHGMSKEERNKHGQELIDKCLNLINKAMDENADFLEESYFETLYEFLSSFAGGAHIDYLFELYGKTEKGQEGFTNDTIDQKFREILQNNSYAKEHLYILKYMTAERIDKSPNFKTQNNLVLHSGIQDARDVIQDYFWPITLLHNNHTRKFLDQQKWNATKGEMDTDTFNMYVEGYAKLFNDESILQFKMTPSDALANKEATVKRIEEFYDKSCFSNPGNIYLEELRQTLNQRLGNGKIWDFDRYETSIQTKDNKHIGLDRISSGEKHDFYIFTHLYVAPCMNEMIHRVKEIFSFTGFDTPERSCPSIFIIDEPEISWHIEWQESFLYYVKQICAKNDIQVIVTTHSPHILYNNRQALVNLDSQDGYTPSESDFED